MIKGKFIIPSLFFVLTLSPIQSSGFSYARVLAQDETIYVSVGDSIDVEKRTLVHNGESKVVSGQIIFPDGSSKSGRSFIVSTPGAYQVVYSAYFGVEEERETINYICNRQSSDFFTPSDKNNAPTVGEYSYNTKTSDIKGAVFNLKTNSTFTLNEILDFNSFNPETPFFEFIIDPSTQGDSDIESFTIRLTDVVDHTNFVDITVTDSGPIDDNGQGCYILAGANNQFKTGYEITSSGPRLHIGSYGANVGSSFRALPTNNPAKTGKIYFDYLEKKLYVSSLHGTNNVKGIITDLDDEQVYSSTVWDGFKEGKAILSVFPTSLLSASAKMIVARAGSTDLSKLVFEDTLAPIFEIDYDGQSSGALPQATVNRPYKIFNAVVNDNYDVDLPYTVSVTYNDTANNKVKDVSITNGTFTPKVPGTYSINYRARDTFNNVGTKRIYVTAVNNDQAMTASLDQSSITQEVYSTFVLPTVNDVHISGGSGKPTIERCLTDSNGQMIEIEGNNFIPTEAGTYYVYYSAIDYIGNVATAKLTLNVQEATKPVFYGDLVLPRVLIKDHTYSLPVYQSMETVDHKSTYLKTDTYVNGALLTDQIFIASDTCNITYKATGSTGTSEHNVSIPVIDSNSSQNQEAYFYGNFSDVTENYADVTLSASSDASAVFAGILPYDTFNVEFAKVNNSTHYQYVSFKFSDTKNPRISLTFKVRFASTGAFVMIPNSTKEYELPFELRDGVETYSLSVNNSKRTLNDINHKIVSRVLYDDNGDVFLGFENGLYLDISLEGVSGASSINIIGISNQKFGHQDFYLDGAAPVIIFKERFVNEQEYGVDAFVPYVEVYDVLGEATATLMVKSPNGDFKLKNVDATLKHSFLLDEFGSYMITYRAEDSSGNFVSYPRKITVFDNLPPALTIDNKLKDTYKLNAEIKIPSYSVSDNLGQYTLDIFLMLPNDEERILIRDVNGQVTSYLSKDNIIYNSSFKVNDNTFRAEQYGTYRLRYVAYDNAFNKVVQEITFVVK